MLFLEPIHDLAFNPVGDFAKSDNFSNFEVKNVKFDELNRDSVKKIALFLTKMWEILVEMEIVDGFLDLSHNNIPTILAKIFQKLIAEQIYSII